LHHDTPTNSFAPDRKVQVPKNRKATIIPAQEIPNALDSHRRTRPIPSRYLLKRERSGVLATQKSDAKTSHVLKIQTVDQQQRKSMTDI
jgi:hypothetical protein